MIKLKEPLQAEAFKVNHRNDPVSMQKASDGSLAEAHPTIVNIFNVQGNAYFVNGDSNTIYSETNAPIGQTTRTKNRPEKRNLTRSVSPLSAFSTLLTILKCYAVFYNLFSKVMNMFSGA